MSRHLQICIIRYRSVLTNKTERQLSSIMGRTKKKATRYGKEKNFNRGGGKVGEGYDLTLRDNELFAKYYQGQGFVPEAEWEQFYETMKKTLPVTFRITGYKSQSEEMLSNIKGKFFKNILNVEVDGETIAPPKCLSWYPNEFAWQLELSRKQIRSNGHLSKLHDFLIAETESGAISRQEAVSMIPPLVMDIQSHHKILDLCAAPGSKTAQLIEYLHSSCAPGELPTGHVIANDSDNKRCYLMVHQVKRLQSPCFAIVNHDGTTFPKIRTNKDEQNGEFQYFDRILCDVPCSGDGTMRKNFDVWQKWHPLQGANMHGLQQKLLKRGCELLALGGRLIYSTCSLNPAEDEAIIAEMLRSSDGAMELVDIQDELPGLKFSKGVSTWKVMTKKGEWIESQADVPENMRTSFKNTIFPPSKEEAEKFNLHKCIRILPHQQDTGGFFVAALKKVKHLPGSRELRLENMAAEQEASAENQEMKDAAANGAVVKEEVNSEAAVGDKRKADNEGDTPKAKKPKIWGYKEDPFFFMENDDPLWASIRDFFGFEKSFPATQILYRSQQGKRTLYFVSEAIQKITVCNDDRVRFINMGVKAFSRSPSPLVPECDYRLAQECVATLLNKIVNRVVKISKQDAITIVAEENPFTHKLSAKAVERLDNMTPGSTVFVFNPSAEEPSPNCELAFCGWRGKTSVRCFGARTDRAHLLMLLGEDLKEINKRVDEKRAKLEAEKKQKEQSETKEGGDNSEGPVDSDQKAVPEEDPCPGDDDEQSK